MQSVGEEAESSHRINNSFQRSDWERQRRPFTMVTRFSSVRTAARARSGTVKDTPLRRARPALRRGADGLDCGTGIRSPLSLHRLDQEAHDGGPGWRMPDRGAATAWG